VQCSAQSISWHCLLQVQPLVAPAAEHVGQIVASGAAGAEALVICTAALARWVASAPSPCACMGARAARRGHKPCAVVEHAGASEPCSAATHLELEPTL